jgi:hypothetical protein
MGDITPAVPIPQGPIMVKMGVNELNPGEWGAANDKCGLDMFEFFGDYRNGHPYALDVVSEKVESLLEDIRNVSEWQIFRDQIARTVRNMTGIKTMICLALGRYVGQQPPGNTWIIQYAVFVYMWELVNQKWQDECKARGIANPAPVERIFQDPDFDLRTVYLLQKIHRTTDPAPNIIVEHPEALNMIAGNVNTFVYAPHLPCRMNPSTLAYRPQVFIGNCSEGRAGWTQAMLEQYLEECKFGGFIGIGPKVDDMWNKIRIARTTYRETKLKFQDEVAAFRMGTLSIFQRPI